MIEMGLLELNNWSMCFICYKISSMISTTTSPWHPENNTKIFNRTWLFATKIYESEAYSHKYSSSVIILGIFLWIFLNQHLLYTCRDYNTIPTLSENILEYFKNILEYFKNISNFFEEYFLDVPTISIAVWTSNSFFIDIFWVTRVLIKIRQPIFLSYI